MIAVIGGSGFIGSRLCNIFNEEGRKFFIIDKKLSPFFSENCKVIDIRDYDNLLSSLKGASTVINLAAEHRDDVSPRSLYDEVNVQGSANICKACEELGINKILFTSSVAVYGFAPVGTDENGKINYFNDYGRTKWEAENIYREWQNKEQKKRSLIIIRPTVVFGERNRGNVYNLLKQISSGLFPMIGNGKNIKSMAYVQNVASFIGYCSENVNGYFVSNYIDKPDFNMNELVKHVKKSLGKKANTGIHWPYFLGLLGGYFFDIIAFITRRKLPISSIRIKKFCANTMFDSNNIKKTSFKAPVSIEQGITNTIQYEFIKEKDKNEVLFYSE